MSLRIGRRVVSFTKKGPGRISAQKAQAIITTRLDDTSKKKRRILGRIFGF